MSGQRQRLGGAAPVEPGVEFVGDELGLFPCCATQEDFSIDDIDLPESHAATRDLLAGGRNRRARRIEGDDGVGQNGAGQDEAAGEKAGQAEIEAQARRGYPQIAAALFEFGVIDADMRTRQHGEDRASVRSQAHARGVADLALDHADLRVSRNGQGRGGQGDHDDDDGAQGPLYVEFHARKINA